ncbi:Bestrophin, RFP-TM, chloride channel-domain-containing protein [Dipodascopsis uninucleata]
MDSRRLFRSVSVGTYDSEASAAGVFAYRHDDEADIDPSVSKESRGLKGKSRNLLNKHGSKKYPKTDHHREKTRSGLHSVSDGSSQTPLNDDTRKQTWKNLRRRILFESEIDQFLNSKVHDDPFARTRVPYALRFRGSIFWKLLPQLLIVAGWASIIVCVAQLKTGLGVSSILITILGFVTSLALSFRVNTAYERYNEGRKFWAQLQSTIRDFARYVWIQIPMKKGYEKESVMKKIVCLKLLAGFAIALKHHLREELGTDYEDLKPFVEYLPTYARKRSELSALEDERKRLEQLRQQEELDKAATAHEVLQSSAINEIQSLEEPLAQTFTNAAVMTPLQRVASALNQYSVVDKINQSMRQWLPTDPKLSEYLIDRNDRISRATVIHGNLPLEILQFIAYYCREMQHEQGALNPSEVSFFYTQTNSLTEILTGTERILRTPLPLAYNILCNQLAWIFVMLLPFQLVLSLGWVAIPATVVAGYVILGLAAIGLEIENPFGFDPNDLDLNRYCQTISVEISMVMSHVPYDDSIFWMSNENNHPLAPVYNGSYEECLSNLEYPDIIKILQQMIEDPSVRWPRQPHKSTSNKHQGSAKSEPHVKDTTSTLASKPAISTPLKTSASAVIPDAINLLSVHGNKTQRPRTRSLPKLNTSVSNVESTIDIVKEQQSTASPASRRNTDKRMHSPIVEEVEDDEKDQSYLTVSPIVTVGNVDPADSKSHNERKGYRQRSTSNASQLSIVQNVYGEESNDDSSYNESDANSQNSGVEVLRDAGGHPGNSPD